MDNNRSFDANHPEGSCVHMFGDNHTHDRADVKQRLYKVIPEEAEAIVIEHREKSESVGHSQWNLLKNPSLILIAGVCAPIQKMERNQAGRVTNGGQTMVVEEIAEEMEIETKYTDLSWLQRFHNQPNYLTVASWIAVLLLFLGWIVSPWFSLVSIVCIPLVALWSNRIHSKEREQKMADDLNDYTDEYSEMVFFAGDSHIEPVKANLRSELEVVEREQSRP